MPSIAKPLPPLEFLNEALRLDAETGALFWKPRPLSHFKSEKSHRRVNAIFAGKRADRVGTRGYMRVTFFYAGKLETYGAHRIVWKLITGRDPVAVIDHIDRVTGNNKPQNLRDVPQFQNSQNRNPVNGLNKRAVPGRTVLRGSIHLRRDNGKYRARISKNGIYTHIGHFATVSAAETAIAEALS